MEVCCAQLFGKWRGKGWITHADGHQVDVDVTIEVVRSQDGGSALFITNYAPLNPRDGTAWRRIAALNYIPGGYRARDFGEFGYGSFRFRYVWGGPFWGVRLRAGPIIPSEWREPRPGNGVERFFFPDAETVWSLAGFCCSETDEDRLTTYFLVTRVGQLGELSYWSPKRWERPAPAQPE